jgi:hypothetical protein
MCFFLVLVTLVNNVLVPIYTSVADGQCFDAGPDPTFMTIRNRLQQGFLKMLFRCSKNLTVFSHLFYQLPFS